MSDNYGNNLGEYCLGEHSPLASRFAPRRIGAGLPRPVVSKRPDLGPEAKIAIDV